MAYEINIGNDEWATSKGGQIGTITDTDTGVKEPFSLNNGRLSGRTSINRDGLLYNVDSFEPAITKVGNDMVFSLEPQGENLFKNSGFAGELTPPQDWAGSLVGKTVVDSIYGSLVKAIEFDSSAGQNYIQQEVSLLSGSKYCLSVKIERFEGVTNIQNIMNIYGLTGTETYFEDNIEIPFSKEIENGKVYKLIADVTSDSLSAMVRIGSGTTSSAPAKVVFSSPQIELGENITSFILSPIGATATRSEDTGNISTDLSKWIDSSGFSAEIDLRYLNNTTINSGDLNITDGTNTNRVTILRTSTAGVLGFRVTKAGTNIAYYEYTYTDLTSLTKLRITTGDNVSDGGAYVDDVRVADWSSIDTSFASGTIKNVILNAKGEVRQIKLS